MAWTDDDFESIKPVICGENNGTAFPVFAQADSIWYVTCAHVVDEWGREPQKVTVGGVPATEVLDGSNQGSDLAIIRVTGAVSARTFALCPVGEPPSTCQIPGCYRPEGKKIFLREPLVAKIPGERADVISPNGTHEMKGWKLEITGKEQLVGGYSGSPLVCVESGEVFAVATLRRDEGRGGIAICISNLTSILPPKLSGILPERGKIDLGETVRIIFAQLATRITVQEIRAACRQSAAFGPLAPWPKGDTLAHYCTWLLDLVQLANGRHPLYDVLALLESKADAEQVRLIRSTMQRLITLHPGLVTDPLPAPVGPCTAEPAVLEIVFEPRVSSEIKSYDVHSFWHPPAGEGNLSGPCRECKHGGRLDLGSADQIGSFAGELMDALDGWDIGTGEVMFLFRLPTELLLRPVEQWPQDRIGTWLGRDHPVVVAPRDRRRQRPCREFWQRITPRMDEPLREGIWYSSSAALACEPADVPEILNRIEQSTGIAITRVPDLSEPRQVTLLAILIERGVAIAFWPRHQDAEHGFREALDAGLGRQILANLPYALRDLRKADYGRGEASPVARHVALLWDDPQYQRKHSFPGIG